LDKTKELCLNSNRAASLQ